MPLPRWPHSGNPVVSVEPLTLFLRPPSVQEKPRSAHQAAHGGRGGPPGPAFLSPRGFPPALEGQGMCGLVVTGCVAAPADTTSLGASFLNRLPETPGSSAHGTANGNFRVN